VHRPPRTTQTRESNQSARAELAGVEPSARCQWYAAAYARRVISSASSGEI